MALEPQAAQAIHRTKRSQTGAPPVDGHETATGSRSDRSATRKSSPHGEVGSDAALNGDTSRRHALALLAEVLWRRLRPAVLGTSGRRAGSTLHVTVGAD